MYLFVARFHRLFDQVHKVRRPKLAQSLQSFITALHSRFYVLFDDPATDVISFYIRDFWGKIGSEKKPEYSNVDLGYARIG